MKIRNDGPDPLAPEPQTGRSGEADRVTGQSQSPSTARQAHAPAATDQVALSPEAQALQAALGQVEISKPEIREDLVQRMRALDAQGALGQDTLKLADAIIERWLGTSREGEDA